MSLPNSVPEPEPDLIECRPERMNWLGVVMLVFMAAMLCAAPWLVDKEGPRPMTPRGHLAMLAALGVFWVPCLAGAVWASVWIRRAAIVADGEKILWRGAGRARGAYWADVSDFYFVRVKSSTKYIVQTPEGRLSFDSSWTRCDDLADSIPRHALVASSRGWELREARSGAPWPREFHYASFGNRWGLPLMPWFGLAYPFAMMATRGANGSGVAQTLSEIQASYGWPMAALFVLVTALVMGLMPALIWIMSASSVRDARFRRHERVHATPEGITWTDGHSSVSSTWGEVIALSAQREPGLVGHTIYFVETTRGSFSFSRQVSRQPLLKSTILEHATHATLPSCDPKSQNANEKPIEHVGQAGAERVFHYRTSMNRALLWLAAAFPFQPMLRTLVLNWSRSLEDGFSPEPLPWPLAILGVCALAWLRWRMCTAAIIISSAGITQLTWRGPRFLAWQSVHKYLHTPETYWLDVLGTDAQEQEQRVRFWASIGSLEELRDEIERRATHSTNRRWQDKAPNKAPGRARQPR